MIIRTLLFLVCAISLANCDTTKNQITNTEKPQKMELSKKQKAVAVLESLETGAKEPIAFINPIKYIQHNQAVGDGLAGFGEVMAHAPEGGFKAKVIRAYEDGDYVFTHTVYDFFGPKIGFDVFRFEDGLIVEHWDNLIETAPNNPSGRSQTDGPTQVEDNDRTESNRALVSSLLQTCFVNGEMDKLGNYFDGNNYIQHNPQVGDGLDGLGTAVAAMAENNIFMVYNTVHKVLAQGNYVLSISEGTFANQPTSYYDLFRVENGKIAEHWDVIETIAAEGDRKNTNGKFNFPK